MLIKELKGSKISQKSRDLGMADNIKIKAKIDVQGSEIEVVVNASTQEHYISLTDMTKSFDGGSALIEQWLRNKDTIIFLGTWEKMYNPGFNSLEFEGIKNASGGNSYYLSVKKWITQTGAIGIYSSAGRYGGTYAHKDIAFEFGTWLSPEFKLYLIREYQRLRDNENSRLSLEWNLNRTLAKLNYRIHTDSIKNNLIPVSLSSYQKNIAYANEADILNVALFGCTAKEWRDANLEKEGNIRDYATIEQLLVLANLESLNAEYIKVGISQQERLISLNKTAKEQMQVLIGNVNINQFKNI
jgi:hypothetical protein